jgi:AcrR family transcriptional regulator
MTVAQRERVLDGMVEAVAHAGYGGASVARVIAAAGVSRATFYEHFSDRDDCFLAAYSRAAQCCAARLAGSGAEGEDPLRLLVAGILTAAEADPAGAAFLTLDSRGNRLTRAKRLALQHELELAAEECLRARRAAGDPVQLPARALLGGIESVVAVRVFKGQTQKICPSLFDLLAWIDSYAEPGGGPPFDPDRGLEFEGVRPSSPQAPPAPVARLPRGRSAIPVEEVTAEQRRRIVATVARLSRERGYQGFTVDDLVGAAGVSRSVFYRLFRHKADAFEAAQTTALQGSIAVAAGAFFGAADWPERVWSGLGALFAHLAAEPDLTCADLVEAFGAEPAAVGRFFESRSAFTLFLNEGYTLRTGRPALPVLCSEAIGGAILELLRAEIQEHGPENLPRALPTSAYVAIAPFVGPREAAAFVRRKLGEGGGVEALKPHGGSGAMPIPG